MGFQIRNDFTMTFRFSAYVQISLIKFLSFSIVYKKLHYLSIECLAFTNNVKQRAKLLDALKILHRGFLFPQVQNKMKSVQAILLHYVFN